MYSSTSQRKIKRYERKRARLLENVGFAELAKVYEKYPKLKKLKRKLAKYKETDKDAEGGPSRPTISVCLSPSRLSDSTSSYRPGSWR